MIQIGGVLGMLSIMRRHPDTVNLLNHVVGEVHGRVKNGSLNINVENVSEIEFRQLSS